MNSDKERHYLYSPWRLDYVLCEKPGVCVLCLYQQLGNDKENLILYRGRTCYVMLNRYPYNNGHLMIVPYEHKCYLEDLHPDTWREMSELIRHTETILKQAYHCHGLNIGMNLGCAAGAGIADHLHVHLVPRWQGDSNFMSVVSGERVIPESFESAWERLKPQYDNLMPAKE